MRKKTLAEDANLFKLNDRPERVRDYAVQDQPGESENWYGKELLQC